MRSGFTLVEVMVAVAIAALLVVGVAAAARATETTAERQKAGAREEEKRARVVELLRQDWRGRTRLLKPGAAPPAGTQVLVLATTADAVGTPVRSTRGVIWRASEKGLARGEGDAESMLILGPAVLKFWDGVAWKQEPTAACVAVGLGVQSPEEFVVIR